MKAKWMNAFNLNEMKNSKIDREHNNRDHLIEYNSILWHCITIIIISIILPLLAINSLINITVIAIIIGIIVNRIIGCLYLTQFLEYIGNLQETCDINSKWPISYIKYLVFDMFIFMISAIFSILHRVTPVPRSPISLIFVLCSIFNITLLIILAIRIIIIPHRYEQFNYFTDIDTLLFTIYGLNIIVDVLYITVSSLISSDIECQNIPLQDIGIVEPPRSSV
ncbi:uncharacterized protein CMU_006020 [Cryptosporidium muris RN66]|uniref:Transmembrane protein n=1 Tax=Cryptosporidium muris (strain RN66) TaxID=441375 RepID=B6AHI4_CRYMR|nr:uncharacterized protein CMU_006020 [Cryptosporidium muris RN66]EEA07679.1 hypothetical protein CMU_006020 [Cryptosporidium muris RN66]|eukprot:XP_002142028.1 hypothetical protein [Cryptosporidium muris RN66]